MKYITARRTMIFGIFLTTFGLGFGSVLAATLGLFFGAAGVIWESTEDQHV